MPCTSLRPINCPGRQPTPSLPHAVTERRPALLPALFALAPTFRTAKSPPALSQHERKHSSCLTTVMNMGFQSDNRRVTTRRGVEGVFPSLTVFTPIAGAACTTGPYTA